MKKSLLGSFLLFLALFAQAQDARTVFINMPDSLMPLLTKVNREDCIDFLDSKMRAQVKNKFGNMSEMTDLSVDYIRMKMTEQSDWQMKLLTTTDSTKIVCAISTACAPACDSEIKFYTTDWQELPASQFILLPVMDDFFLNPDSTKQLEYTEARDAADLFLMKASLNKEDDTLTFSMTTTDYLSQEIADKVKSFLSKPLAFEWVSDRKIFVKR